MKIQAAILTCPSREGILRDTLDGFIRSGIPKGIETVVYCDSAAPRGQSHVVQEPWQYRYLWAGTEMHSRGNLAAFTAIIAIAAFEKVERLLYFEDDVLPCKNAIERMISVGVPDEAAFTTFFDMKEFYPGAPHGLYEVPLRGIDGRGFWGLQAVTMNGDVLAKLHKQQHLAQRSNELRNHSDMVLIEAMEQLGYESYAAHIPCLVEHTGYTDSAIWQFESHDISRTATNFKGIDFDALQSVKE